ncbi:MAG: cytochrome-c peroxidase [Burkholderiales bacterium]|jgi:cytochrome c peroxidase|nr:cytochrome-c peroxidase [Burkholderiales bacterium]
MKRITLVITAFCALLLPLLPMAQEKKDDLLKEARELFEPIGKPPGKITDNDITPAKIELGKMLYFDPRLSSSGLISCNTCHNLGLGGDDGLPVAIGHDWKKGPRNSPTVFNSVFNAAQFWDGRAADLKEQAKGPIQAGVEMNSTPELVVATLKSIPGYKTPFEQAFGKGDTITFDNVARAIEAFEVTLITPDAPFDRYLKGDEKALTDQQKRGLKTFIDQNCASCHSGVNLGGQSYFPFGLVTKPEAKLLPTEDKGRFAVTNTAGDDYVFRAAPLRNVAITAPYFHSGQIRDLRDAVTVMATTQLGAKMNDKDIDDVAAFLNSLTGKKPVVSYPDLPPSTTKTPVPVQ